VVKPPASDVLLGSLDDIRCSFRRCIDHPKLWKITFGYHVGHPEASARGNVWKIEAGEMCRGTNVPKWQDGDRSSLYVKASQDEMNSMISVLTFRLPIVVIVGIS
jgi:hypothetical protein